MSAYAEPLPKPGPEENENRCDECGGHVDRYGDPCGFCRSLEELFNSEEFARFEELCEEIRAELMARRVGGMCVPLEEAPS